MHGKNACLNTDKERCSENVILVLIVDKSSFLMLNKKVLLELDFNFREEKRNC